jgi:hypothetical protein
MAKMGIVLMIFAIIGLVIAAVVPWIIVEKEVEGYVCQECGYFDEEYFWQCPDCFSWDVEFESTGEKESFSFNGDLELVDGDEDTWGGDEFTTFDDMEDYFKGSVGLAFWGFLLVIIIAIVLIIIGVMAAAGRPSAGLLRGLGVIVAALLIIPGAMIMVSGMNFLGFNITEMHANGVTEDLGGDVTSSTLYPAAYIILIFGVIIFLIAFIITKKELQKVTPLPQTQQTAPYQQTQPPMQPQQPMPPQYPGGGYNG